MTLEFCTLFDSAYLPRGLALHQSLQAVDPAAHLRAFCMDEMTKRVLDRLRLPGLTAISLTDLESHDPKLLAVKGDRSRVEYCWTATPSAVLFCLEREPDLDLVTYLDADVFFFASPAPFLAELGDGSILIVPHRYAPDHTYLKEMSGTYNVEFVTFRNDSSGLQAARWWRDRCVEWCYNRVDDGLLGDQKYLDDWPERFDGVRVLENEGGGVAPWNASQYRFHARDRKVFVNDDPLVFYHFHSLRLARHSSRLLSLLSPQTPTVSNDGEPIVWLNAYEIGSEEKSLVWEPYLDRLRVAMKQVRSVEPGFDAGFVGPGDLAIAWARSKAGAFYYSTLRKLSRLPTALKS